MRVAVAIVPRLLMTVVAAGRNELIQNGGQVMLQSWLELNRTDRENLTHRSTLLSHRPIHILDRAMRSAEDLYDIVYRRDMQHGCQPR